MNDLYIHQLETENKQLREVLKINHQIIDMYVERMDKANEILNKGCFEYDNCPDSVINEIIELKEILGDKENE
jgi:hypothetical protein